MQSLQTDRETYSPESYAGGVGLKYFNVFKDTLPCIIPGFISLLVNQLFFYCGRSF
jgi:hypothetical protein